MNTDYFSLPVRDGRCSRPRCPNRAEKYRRRPGEPDLSLCFECRGDYMRKQVIRARERTAAKKRQGPFIEFKSSLYQFRHEQ